MTRAIASLSAALLMSGWVYVALAFIVALPLVAIALQAVFPHMPSGVWTEAFSHWVLIQSDPLLLELLGNTLSLGLSVTLLSLLLGGSLGVLRGLRQVPMGRFWDVVMLIPFMMPPYIGAMAWTFSLQPGGYSTQLLGVSANEWLFSSAGIALIMALHLFPVVYFAVSRTVAAIGDRFLEAASVCGANKQKQLVRIVLPLSMPAWAASLLLVFSLSIEEYGTPAVLGKPSQFLVLVTRIEEKFAEWPIDLAGAALLSLMLLSLSLMAYFLQRHLQRNAHVVSVSGKGSTSSQQSPIRFPLLTTLCFVAVALFAVGLPVFGMLATAFSKTLSGGLAWDNLGLRHFAAVVSNETGALDSLWVSWSLGGVTAMITAILGGSAAWLSVRRSGASSTVLNAMASLPNALPAMVLAVGLILVWNQPFWPMTPYNTYGILLLAYVCLLLPYPVQYIGTAIKQISPSLEESARVSGARPLLFMRKIMAPMLAPQTGAAMLLVFAVASRELVASVMLSPPGTKTVSTFIFNQFSQGSPNEGMALAAVAIGLSTLILVLVQVRFKPSV